MKRFRIAGVIAAILALSMVFMASAGALALNHDHDHDDKHQHAYVFDHIETRVLSSDESNCATVQVACYICCGCGDMIYNIINGTYRSGAHEFQYRTSIPGGDYELPVINWVCKHCGYITYTKPPQHGVIS